MTDAEFRSRYERLGVVVEGSTVSTQLVRDTEQVVRMAHILGSEDGPGAVRLAAVNRLPAKVQEAIVERCLVGGVWVLVTRNLDDFVDFDQWMEANGGAPAAAFVSDVFGPRLGGQAGDAMPRPGKESARPVRRSTPEPRPTELFGPQLKPSDLVRPPASLGGPARNTPQREAKRAEASVDASRSAPQPSAAGPKVFWRDLREDAVVQAEPAPVEPPAPTVPPPRLAADASDLTASSAGLAQVEKTEPTFPAPLPSYRIHSQPGETKPAPLHAHTMERSMPRIPLPGRSSAAARFTQVISGRPQGALDDAPAEGGSGQAQDSDEAPGFPKWLIITMVVIAVVSVVLIVIGFVI